MADRGKRGGKRANNLYSATGYYGRHDAGTPYDLTPKKAGTKRKFIGSDVKEYTFYNESKGTLTITARTFEDALRVAKIRGYRRKNYRE